MKPLPATEENIRRAAGVIRDGGIVAFPTETVYGLGADAFNPEAVARIFEAKQRPFFDPLIVHIGDIQQLDMVAASIPGVGRECAHRFWPGPFTMVLPKSGNVPDIVTAGLDTVGIRMPAHDIARRLIGESGTPLAAPSANPFGYISPTSAAHVARQLGNRVDMILDGGPCAVGVESTIVGMDESGCTVLRHGGLPAENIEDVTGKLYEKEKTGDPQAPGQLPYHYSPSTPVILVDAIDEIQNLSSHQGILAFTVPDMDTALSPVEVLSPEGSLRKAAARLFDCLHRLDGMGLTCIYAQKVPEEGLGRAIMDRLRKAAARTAG